jgi:hypothetical protein
MTTCTSMFGVHHRLAEIALRHVTDCVAPKILDLAAGNGGLSRTLLDKHPNVEVTVTDLDPIVVGSLTLSDLGNHARALCVMPRPSMRPTAISTSRSSRSLFARCHLRRRTGSSARGPAPRRSY